MSSNPYEIKELAEKDSSKTHPDPAAVTTYPEKFRASFREALEEHYLSFSENVSGRQRMEVSDNDLIHYVIPFLNAHPKITLLELSGSSISCIGAIALANNKTLRTLNLVATRIGDMGTKALVANETLTSLDISFNRRISDAALKVFLNNVTLHELRIERHGRGEDIQTIARETLNRHNQYKIYKINFRELLMSDAFYEGAVNFLKPILAIKPLVEIIVDYSGCAAERLEPGQKQTMSTIPLSLSSSPSALSSVLTENKEQDETQRNKSLSTAVIATRQSYSSSSTSLSSSSSSMTGQHAETMHDINGDIEMTEAPSLTHAALSSHAPTTRELDRARRQAWLNSLPLGRQSSANPYGIEISEASPPTSQKSNKRKKR